MMEARCAGKTFKDCFSLVSNVEVLGEGSFGTVVRRARDLETNEEYAVKCVQLKRLSSRARADVEREVMVVKELSHPSLLRHFYSFQDRQEVYLVSELMRGGDLFDRLVLKGSFTEVEARRIVLCVVEGIRYLHEKDIVHRDIKPENVVLREASKDNLQCVLCDFGFAKKLPSKDAMLRTDCGTQNYAAPEIFMGRLYGKGVDVWGLGVCTFMLVAGYHPFADGSVTSLYTKVCSGRMNFESDVWDSLSDEVKSFVCSLMTVDPAKRPTIQDVSMHPWLLQSA